ncbi:NmrA family protein [Gemmatirosa kalamazoonensis]|uniref:NmrA family protein n=1 Tax=Gemmatirosa kalamazoonensis TaxID=861299 RepID=W0RHG8_9BACT|nr:SDR family oxidoreductase [Gemmatirosa kalamazoonensis]AHG89765.1 NmrA family protein [Gemmatirosa kalamazoonensis]
MILVVGATGILGGEICRRLTERGESVRGLVRATSRRETVERLTSIGVETVEGDLRDRASLDRACDGVDAVITTATTTLSRQPGDGVVTTDQNGQLALVDAARGAGVRRFVYVSYSGNFDDDEALTRAKRTVERAVRESGMTYTILRPSVFMDIWLSPALGFDYGAGRVTVFGSGEAPISWISLGDVAEFAVRAVREPAADNAVIELGGPEALCPNDVVRIFEETAGRPFQVERVPEEALRAKQAAATEELDRAFATLMVGFTGGDPIPMDETLRRFPATLTTVRDYARRVLSA